MAENNQRTNPQQQQQAPPSELANRIALQEKRIAELEDYHKKNELTEPTLELRRERDILRHLRLMQKGKPLERAQFKANYAAKSALSRAIQPVER